MFRKLSRFHQILLRLPGLKCWKKLTQRDVWFQKVQKFSTIPSVPFQGPPSSCLFRPFGFVFDRILLFMTVYFRLNAKYHKRPFITIFLENLILEKSELRFFGLTKDLTFRFQFWNAGIIKIIRAKYQWLQIFQIDYLTFQQFTIRIIGYSMTSPDSVQRFLKTKRSFSWRWYWRKGKDALEGQYGRVRQYAFVVVDRSFNRLIIVEIDLHWFSLSIGQKLMRQLYFGPKNPKSVSRD